MTPIQRKITYAVAFETLGIFLASQWISWTSGTPVGDTLVFSALNAAVALAWNLIFNTVFEYWEARQPRKGRPFLLRAIHAVLFELGLTAMMVPFMAWWLGVTLMQALLIEASLIALFLCYTWAFTWAFDRIFGLPKSAL
jgi:uncharacterized membrane protein